MKILIGKQWLINCRCCNYVDTNDLNRLYCILRDLCNVMDAKIVKSSHYKFSPHGISLFAIISASHIAIHTWPEYGFLNIDIFSCNQNCLPEASLSDLISERIATQEIDIQVIDHYINV